MTQQYSSYTEGKATITFTVHGMKAVYGMRPNNTVTGYCCLRPVSVITRIPTVCGSLGPALIIESGIPLSTLAPVAGQRGPL
jgi:hypothetical protein